MREYAVIEDYIFIDGETFHIPLNINILAKSKKEARFLLKYFDIKYKEVNLVIDNIDDIKTTFYNLN